jgi:hypothetical protein
VPYPQNGLYSLYRDGGDWAGTTLTYNSSTSHPTQYSTQYWNVLDLSHRQSGGATLVANSPWAIDDWRAWNTGTATYTNTQTIYYPASQLWREWCIQTNGSATYQYDAQPPPMTAEELAAHNRAVEEHKAKAARAKVRARSLLDSVLSPEQRQYMERHGYIPVVGSKGRRYHIRTTGGASGNVVLVDDKEAVEARFCAHPRSTHDGHFLPNEDQFLAQVLHLQDDEDDFLGKANTVEGRNPVRGLALAG